MKLINKNDKDCYILCSFLWQIFIHVILPEQSWTLPETSQKGQQNAVLFFSHFFKWFLHVRRIFLWHDFLLTWRQKISKLPAHKNTSVPFPSQYRMRDHFTLWNAGKCHIYQYWIKHSWNMKEFYSTWILHLLITLCHNSDSKTLTQSPPLVVALTVSVPYLSYAIILPQEKETNQFLFKICVTVKLYSHLSSMYGYQSDISNQTELSCKSEIKPDKIELLLNSLAWFLPVCQAVTSAETEELVKIIMV